MNKWLKWITITAGSVAGAALTVATAGLAAPIMLKIAAIAGGVGTASGALMRSPIKSLQTPAPEKKPKAK